MITEKHGTRDNKIMYQEVSNKRKLEIYGFVKRHDLVMNDKRNSQGS